MPNDTAQIAGMKTLELPPIKTCAAITGQKSGKKAMTSEAASQENIPLPLVVAEERGRQLEVGGTKENGLPATDAGNP
jgi:hypothetical protein